MTDSDIAALRDKLHAKRLSVEDVRSALSKYEASDRSHSEAIRALFDIADAVNARIKPNI